MQALSNSQFHSSKHSSSLHFCFAFLKYCCNLVACFVVFLFSLGFCLLTSLAAYILVVCLLALLFLTYLYSCNLLACFLGFLVVKLVVYCSLYIALLDALLIGAACLNSWMLNYMNSMFSRFPLACVLTIFPGICFLSL